MYSTGLLDAAREKDKETNLRNFATNRKSSSQKIEAKTGSNLCSSASLLLLPPSLQLVKIYPIMIRTSTSAASRLCSPSTSKICRIPLGRIGQQKSLSTQTISQSYSRQSQSTKRGLGYSVGALALAGSAYLVASSSLESVPTPLSPPSFNSNDPLSSLDPSALQRTTAHLTGQRISDLLRQWVVFAVSEQSTLVSAGPWIMGKIEWTRDNVPILGSAVWAVFAFVSRNYTFNLVSSEGEC